AASSARAQGTSGTLPNPITTQELNEYGKWLKLSDQQRQAAEKAHDEYKNQFRALREGEITQLMKDMRSMDMGVPQRKQAEAFLKKMDELNDKIAAVDSRLFDSLMPTLTEAQNALLPRVRMARERARYGDQQMMMGMFGMPPVDVSEIFHDMEVPAEVFEAADAAMASYEARITSEMGKLRDSISHIALDMLDAFEKQGINEETMKDPEAAQKSMEAMQTVMRDITKKGRERLA